MKLTREEAIQKTRDMWNWIANETEMWEECVSKGEFFEDEDEVPMNRCYLCEYVWQKRGRGKALDCRNLCPLDFGEYIDFACEYAEKSPYHEWRYEGDWWTSVILAREIANLPEREV